MPRTKELTNGELIERLRYNPFGYSHEIGGNAISLAIERLKRADSNSFILRHQDLTIEVLGKFREFVVQNGLMDRFRKFIKTGENEPT